MWSDGDLQADGGMLISVRTVAANRCKMFSVLIAIYGMKLISVSLLLLLTVTSGFSQVFPVGLECYTCFCWQSEHCLPDASKQQPCLRENHCSAARVVNVANSATAEHLFLHFAGDDKAAGMRNTCNIVFVLGRFSSKEVLSS